MSTQFEKFKEFDSPLGEGKPSVVDSVEDSILTIQDCLRQISNMAHQAFYVAAEHPCVPVSHVQAWKNAYQKQAQDLQEANRMQERLKALYEDARADTDNRERGLEALRCRFQELEDQVSEHAVRVKTSTHEHDMKQT